MTLNAEPEAMKSGIMAVNKFFNHRLTEQYFFTFATLKTGRKK